MLSKIFYFLDLIASKLIKPIAQDQEPIKLDKRKKYIVPTMEGIVYILLFTITSMLCMSYRNNIAFSILSFLMAYFFISLFKSNSILKKAVVKDVLINPTTPNSETSISILVEFIKIKQIPCSDVSIGHKLYKSEFFNDTTSIAKINIKAPSEPGVYKLPEMSLSTTWPIMTTYAWTRFKPSKRLIVMPELNDKNINEQGSNTNNIDNSLILKKSASGDPFTFKERSPGDSTPLFWKQTLKRGKPIVMDRVDASSGVSIIEWPDKNINVIEGLKIIRPKLNKASSSFIKFSVQYPDGSFGKVGQGKNHEINAITEIMMNFTEHKDLVNNKNYKLL